MEKIPKGNEGMAEITVPTLDEVALGGFLEDIGKFMQRAHGSSAALPRTVHDRAAVLLPTDGRGRGGYTHKHVLWTDAFFEWMDAEGLSFPRGINAARVRDMAVYHHNPDRPLAWLSAVADRLSAGMDRKAQDEAEESKEGPDRWDKFRRVPLRCLLAKIDIGVGPPCRRGTYSVAEFAPETMFPVDAETQALPGAYERLWPMFRDAFRTLCESAGDNIELFHEGLLAISERFTWAIPSSTVDQPDVSLHDHNRTVAAIAACLYAHHRERGELADERAIRDNSRPKFRLLVGDLSGIQSSLFRLVSQQAKGVNRILRARSFLMDMLVEAGAILCRRALDLPAYCLLQHAGGRFELLVPEVDRVEEIVDDVRKRVDAWMFDRFLGDLALNLSLTPAFSGEALRVDKYAEVRRMAAIAAETAKQRSLATVSTGVVARDFPAHGPCATCGLRPATERDTDPDGSDVWRCRACAHEHAVGGRLPRARVVMMQAVADGAAASQAFFGALQLALAGSAERKEGHPTSRDLVAAWRVRGADGVPASPVADRFLANYVPVLTADDLSSGRYADLDPEDAAEAQVGNPKTLAHLAADAREPDGQGGWTGRALLAVVKADVDRLGWIFSHGLGAAPTVGRIAALSRMLNAFFTGRLTDLLRRRFPNVYTVYAGGDDVLLIAPWLTGITVADALREEFRRFVGNNPNLTLSAGVEFVHPHEPLNRAVGRAERRLRAAKACGRDRICLVTEKPIPWRDAACGLDWALAEADWLNGAVRGRLLPTGFLHRMLAFEEMRRRAEDPHRPDPRAANWRARWGYHLSRLRERLDSGRADETARRLDALFGGGLMAERRERRGDTRPDPVIPITIALYRNR